MNRESLRDFVPAAVTPFSNSGEIMFDAFSEVLDFLVKRGASAICIAGDNGESWALSPTERGQLVRHAKDHLGKDMPILLGISAPTFAGVKAYVEAAVENGADALLSMPPTYVLKTSDAELLNRFDQIGKVTDLPLVLYNSPRRAGVSITVDQIERICDASNIIGIKESQRDYFHHCALLHRLADRISVMTGPCHYILPAYGLGARGFIATGPEFISAKPSELEDIANAPGSPQFRQAQHQLSVIYQTLMGTATWPASFKAALNLIGVPAGDPRDPVLAATREDTDTLCRMFDQLEIGRK